MRGETAPLERYLASWAEPIARPDFEPNTPQEKQNLARINACRAGRYRWVLVVPVFDEALDCIDTLIQELNFEPDTKSLLVIQVLNVPDDANEDAIARTQAALPDSASATPKQLAHGIDVLTLDAVSKPLPADQATGLARKIGNDIACQLLAQGHITTPILCNTDADAILPGDYFARITRARAEATRSFSHPTSHSTQAVTSAANTTAWVMPFEHLSDDPQLKQAGTIYELYLRALQLNLHRCGSPYAYPALGSVLAIDPIYYAKSRGFPKRRAGEDFYLLNKLAKLGEVSYLTGRPIRLAARASLRVPFGTGPAIAKLLNIDPVKIEPQTHRPYERLETYALESFALLRQFYAGLGELEASDTKSHSDLAARKLPKAWQDPDLLWLLKRLGVPGAVVRLRKNHRSTHTLQRAMHEWFDALKTVRFLNEARHFHADEPLINQFKHLQSFLPEDQETSVNKQAHDADERWLLVSKLNRDLELGRSTTRHCVALSVADCLT